MSGALHISVFFFFTCGYYLLLWEGRRCVWASLLDKTDWNWPGNICLSEGKWPVGLVWFGPGS